MREKRSNGARELLDTYRLIANGQALELLIEAHGFLHVSRALGFFDASLHRGPLPPALFFHQCFKTRHSLFGSRGLAFILQNGRGEKFLCGFVQARVNGVIIDGRAQKNSAI